MSIPTIINILVISYLFVLSQSKKDKCYVLALAAGGDRGAYEAGVIKGLSEINTIDTQWDVVTGISVGSLNAAGIAIFEQGKESEAADYLLDKWRTIKGTSDVFKNWKYGPLYGLFFETGIFDTTPLRKLLTDIISKHDLKRKFVIGTTDILNGTFVTFDDEMLSKKDYIEALMISSAVPVIFPHVDFRNRSFVDGGVRMSIDIPSGINKCIGMGYKGPNIVVDSVLMNSRVLRKLDHDDLNSISTLERILEVRAFDYSMKALEFALLDFPLVNFRYVITPSRALPSSIIPLTFSPEEIEEMIHIGIEDAKKAVGIGFYQGRDAIKQYGYEWRSSFYQGNKSPEPTKFGFLGEI